MKSKFNVVHYLIFQFLVFILSMTIFFHIDLYVEKRKAFLYSLLENENEKIKLNSFILGNIYEMEQQHSQICQVASTKQINELLKFSLKKINNIQKAISVLQKSGTIEFDLNLNVLEKEKIKTKIRYTNYYPNKANITAIELSAKLFELKSIATKNSVRLKDLIERNRYDEFLRQKKVVKKIIYPFLKRMKSNANRLYFESINNKIQLKKKIDKLLLNYHRIKIFAIFLFMFIMTIFLLVLVSHTKKILFLKQKAEAELKETNENLEKLVEKRTKSLDKAYKKMQKLATTDPLTKLVNRRFILDKITHEVHRFERISRPFTIIMADIDNFKFFNDKYGHDCGDFVLVSIANTMKSITRKTDTVSRWGGEEILILSIETSIEGGLILAEKLRKTISEKIFRYKDLDLSISLTFGVAQYNGESDVDITIKHADEALYFGKENGKNCVINYEEIKNRQK